MKYLWLLLLAATAFGQNIRYDNVAFGPKGPIPNATIAVCSQPATTSTQPCTPAVKLCSSLTDTACTLPNPFFADALGNFHFYVSSGSTPVTIQIYGPGVAVPLILSDQLTGTSGTVLAPLLSLVPSTLGFGTVQTTTTSPSQNLTILNVGNASLTVTSVVLTGSSGFSSPNINACNGVLASGSSCVLSFTYSPTVAAAETATVTVNASGISPSPTASLTGTGSATNSFPLTVTVAGTGSGVVVSNENPPLIDCTSSGTSICSANYSSGASVTLTATPSSGSTFQGFTGGGCSGGGSTCTLSITQATTVTATFVPPSVNLTLTGTGAGTGTMTSDASTSSGTGQLACTSVAGVTQSAGGAGCSGPFVNPTTVTITASPAAGSTFVGWSGVSGCTTSTTCVVTLSANTTLTGNFTSSAIPLSLKQTASCNTNTANQIACNWASAQAAGDIIICAGNWGDITTTVSSVTDTSVNTYTQVPTVSPKTNVDLTQVVYYAPNILAAAAGANTTTFALSANAANRNARCLEYAGVLTAAPIDVSAAAVGATATPASGIATTTVGNDLVTGFTVADTSILRAATGFTQQILQNLGGGGNSFSVVQTANNFACAKTPATTCVLTWGKATGAGHAIVIIVQLGDSTTLVTGVSGGGTFTQCCQTWASNAGKSIQTAYTMNSTSGATSTTITIGTAQANAYRIVGLELAYSGTSFALDGTPIGNLNGTACTACVVPNFSLTGTNDTVLQSFVSGAVVNSISSPYVVEGPALPQNTDLAASLNTNSGTGPTWTASASLPINGLGMNTLAIKGTASSTGADAEDIQGVASGTAQNFQPTLSAAANWVATEVAWKAQVTSPGANTVSVTITGAGGGTGGVTSNAGSPVLSCSVASGVATGTCSTSIPSGGSITVTAAPNSSSVFAGWSGASGCSSSATCTLSSLTTNVVLQATFNTSGTTIFTVNNQPPATWNPYSGNAKSIYFKPLPADVMSHLAANSAAYVTCLMDNSNNCGMVANQKTLMQVQTPSLDGHGAANDQNPPMYYATKSDPWYKISPNQCNFDAKINVVFHAPAGASLSGGNPSNANDQQINIWDQDQGLIIEWGGEFGTRESLPAGGATAATAVSIGMSPADCAVYRANDPSGNAPSGSVDYDWVLSGTLAGQFGNVLNQTYTSPQTGLTYTINGLIDPGAVVPGEPIVRAKEWMSGTIPHALDFTWPCSANNQVFPSTSSGANSTNVPSCPSATTFANQLPPSGSLVFCDYTPAQISGMNLPPWESTLLTAFCTYGGYLTVTNGNAGIGLALNNHWVESGQAYSNANNFNWNADPLYGWLNGAPNSITCDNGAAAGGGSECRFTIIPMFPNIPLVGGTGLNSHIHVADPCIPEGLAGLPGGCN